MFEAVKPTRYIKRLCSALNPFRTRFTSVFQKFPGAIARIAVPQAGDRPYCVLQTLAKISLPYGAGL
ncbi:hypothetical protein [Tolypothrix sp. VBCCA 56010]|uniref:hypothetical protein n=1 Tax=Tolypothrix sp. VBCCA 56010 TaxID=3137731 RepID=UPI003D7D7E1F